MPLIKRKMDAAVALNDPIASSLICDRMRNKASGAGRRVIIGMGAYNRMPEQLKAMLRATLEDAAKKKKCSVNDLTWTIGYFGKNNMPVIRINKRERIEVPRR